MSLVEFLTEAVSRGRRSAGKYGKMSVGMDVTELVEMVDKANIRKIIVTSPYVAVRDYDDGKQYAIFCSPARSYSGEHLFVWLFTGDQTRYSIDFCDRKLKDVTKQVYQKGGMQVTVDDVNTLLREIESKFF